VVLVTFLVTLLTPKQYSSEMQFLVQNARGNVVVTPERTSSSDMVSGVTEEQVNSELVILHSHDVADPVADPQWASLPESERTPTAIRQHEKLLHSFETRFSTAIVRKTNVISVSLLAESPELAQRKLQLLSVNYLAEHRRLQRPAGASKFFATETERIRQEWNDANRQLAAFQQLHQLLSLPDRESAIDDQIVEGEHDQLTGEINLRELDARLAESSRQLQQIPARQNTEDKVIPNPQSIEHLNSLLVDLENNRTALLTKYQPTDRLVVQLDEQIATTKSALENASRMTTHERSTDVDPAWQQVHTNYVETLITKRATEEHRTKVAAQLNGLRDELASLRKLTVDFNNLQARADELKDNYQLYSEKRDQAQVEDAMDQQNLINVAVAQQPTISYLPERPKVITNMILGTLTALFLGLCAVYFSETARSTIATPRELSTVSRYPVLATVPETPSLAGGFSLDKLVLVEIRSESR
jgi:uncharacterized protein involved in exopolysaccharide biosynthesis